MSKDKTNSQDSICRDADLDEEVRVGMEGEWKTASPPNWLMTEGVGSCIAVAVACITERRAWLVHAPNFHHEASGLVEMLREAALVAPSGKGLHVWMVGGVPADGCEAEGNRDRRVVQDLVKQILPHAAASCEWSECERVELIFAKNQWQCIRT